MLQLVWCSDFVATTTSLTPSRYCTSCVCRNESISSWRWWRTVCWTVWRRRTWINLFRYPALLVVALLRSSFTLQLLVPSYRLSTAGRRSIVSGCSLYVLEHFARWHSVCTTSFCLPQTSKKHFCSNIHFLTLFSRPPPPYCVPVVYAIA